MRKIIDILNENKVNGFSERGGTDKSTEHSYDIFYEEILSDFIDKEVSLLEIGVQYGGSSLLWHEFLPKSKLILVDIIDQVDSKIWDSMDENRYNYHIMDAYDQKNFSIIESMYSDGFDIIIDDGPHTVESQIYTIKNYTKLLKNGGILIIEDIQNYGDVDIIINSIGNIPHKSCELVDLRGVKGRYDDLLIVVKM